jgi:hypothetical protein
MYPASGNRSHGSAFGGSGLRLRGRLTKDEAQQESLRRWRELPEDERQTHTDAKVFAAGLAEVLDFRTMANERKIIEAWLIRELEDGRQQAAE